MECVRLAEALRGLRAGTGLSLAALASKTPYSKSSWERYLNGKALPPRQAVAELCTLAGERPQRAVALWELAESAWSGRAGAAPGSPARTATAPAPPPEPDPEPSPASDGAPDARPPWRSAGFVAGVLGGLAAVAVGILLVTWGFGGSGTGAEAEPSSSAPGPSCTGDACTGKDPEATRCSAAAYPPSTLGERRFGDGTVLKMRRSAECGAVWVRIDRGLPGDRAEITAPRIGAQQTEVRDRFDAEGSLSTPMAAAGKGDLRDVRACLVRAGDRQCFGVKASR